MSDTGAELLEQVREALADVVSWRDEQQAGAGSKMPLSLGLRIRRAEKALAALDGCVLLTAEEAAEVSFVLAWMTDKAEGPARVRRARALLTPDPEQGE